MPQRIVIKVSTSGKNSRGKIFEIAGKFPGVQSIKIIGQEKNHVEVIGDGIDATKLMMLLRKKVGSSELVSLGHGYGPINGFEVSNHNLYGYGPSHGYEVSNNERPYAYGGGYGYEIRSQSPYEYVPGRGYETNQYPHAYGPVHGYETKNPYVDGSAHLYESRNEDSDGCCSIM